jgi:glycosyltransferase involved in cell wall biosynthesis
LRRHVEQERSQAIEFRGRLSDAERDLAYRSAPLLFYLSAQEGFGLAGVEAPLAFGLPLLGLAGTVVEELFPNGEGVVVASDLGGDSIGAGIRQSNSKACHCMFRRKPACAIRDGVWKQPTYKSDLRRLRSFHAHPYSLLFIAREAVTAAVFEGLRSA